MNGEHVNLYIRECPLCGSKGELITFNNPLDRGHYGYVKCINCMHQSEAMWIDNNRIFVEDVVARWNKGIEESTHGIIKEEGPPTISKEEKSTEKMKELEEKCLKLENMVETLTDKLNEVVRHCNRVTEKIQNNKHRKFYFIHTISEDENYGNDD